MNKFLPKRFQWGFFLKCSVCASWKIASQENVSSNLHSDTCTCITRKGKVSDSTCTLPLKLNFEGEPFSAPVYKRVRYTHTSTDSFHWKARTPSFEFFFPSVESFFCFFTWLTFTARMVHVSPNCRSFVQHSTQMFILNDSKLFVNLLLQPEFSSAVWKWPWNLVRNITSLMTKTLCYNDLNLLGTEHNVITQIITKFTTSKRTQFTSFIQKSQLMLFRK
jgi:hypothetical protein